MNDKENAQRIIEFDEPERVLTGAPTHQIAYLGCNHENFHGDGHHLPVGSKWKDIWGTEWHREHEGVMAFPRGNPLEDLPNSVDSFDWPDPDDERICSKIYDDLEGWDSDETFLFGKHRDTLWEKSYMLVGMESMMMFFYTEPDAVKGLFHRLMDFQLGIAAHYMEAGIEMVGMTDDLGSQDGLLFSPDIINEFFVPEYKRLFDFYKTRDVLVHFHSCGHIEPILDIFMDLGVDILNPLQASANDLEKVRSITQGKMALHGGVSSGLIVSGPIEDIREETGKRMLQLGRYGGYFCSPDQGMPWPEEHIQALRDTVEECGTYPLE